MYHNPKKNIYSTPKVEGAMQRASIVPMALQSLKEVLLPKQWFRLSTGKKNEKKMLQDYTSTENGILVLTSDKTFSSPSTAADFCIGSSNNGWLIWKDKDGNTLDSVYRKQLD